MGLLRTPCGDAEDTVSLAHEGEVLCCAFAARRGWAASGGWDGCVIFWEPATGKAVATWRAAEKPVTACTFSPDGSQFFTGTMNGLLAAWDPLKRERKTIFLAHTRPISGIEFSPDGKTLATSSWDATINLWQFEPEKNWKTLAGHKDIVAGCRFLPDNKSLLSWSHDGTLRLWDVMRAKQIAAWSAHSDRITAADVSPDGRWFVSSGRDGHVILWNAATQKEEARYTHARGDLPWCGFTPDAQGLLCVSAKGELMRRSVPDLQKLPTQSTGYEVQSAALSPTGDYLVIGTVSGHVQFHPLPEMAQAPLCVTAIESQESRPTFLEKLLGRDHLIRVLRCTCPICHRVFELHETGRRTAVCPECQRRLHVNPFTLSLES